VVVVDDAARAEDRLDAGLPDARAGAEEVLKTLPDYEEVAPGQAPPLARTQVQR
jgi:hypothetical protein